MRNIEREKAEVRSFWTAKLLPWFVGDPSDCELRCGEVRGGGVVVKREEKDERHTVGHEFPSRNERLVTNPSEQFGPIACPKFQGEPACVTRPAVGTTPTAKDHSIVIRLGVGHEQERRLVREPPATKRPRATHQQITEVIEDEGDEDGETEIR